MKLYKRYYEDEEMIDDDDCLTIEEILEMEKEVRGSNSMTKEELEKWIIKRED